MKLCFVDFNLVCSCLPSSAWAGENWAQMAGQTGGTRVESKSTNLASNHHGLRGSEVARYARRYSVKNIVDIICRSVSTTPSLADPSNDQLPATHAPTSSFGRGNDPYHPPPPLSTGPSPPPPVQFSISGSGPASLDVDANGGVGVYPSLGDDTGVSCRQLAII